jgi:hypothetical protein
MLNKLWATLKSGKWILVTCLAFAVSWGVGALLSKLLGSWLLTLLGGVFPVAVTAFVASLAQGVAQDVVVKDDATKS